MASITYFDGKRLRKVELQGILDGRQAKPVKAQSPGFVHGPSYIAMRPQSIGSVVLENFQEMARVATRFRAFTETMVMPVEPGRTTIVPTETVALDNPRKADIKFCRSKFGLEVVSEGSHGKVLMRVPDGVADPLQHAAEAALAVDERGGRTAAHPNFIRLVQHLPVPAVAPGAVQWGLDNPGSPGLIGADVAALAAWTVSRGTPEIRVAVLDEGVDTEHPYLKPAVVAQADFVDQHPTAGPDGDDAHGTACAGIVLSRNDDVSGLAPGTSLVAARIAKSAAGGIWVYDDYDTADAIDWCWDTAAADVLSNSWGGGDPGPIVTRAIERAQSQGRKGLGAVVVVAAGNEQAEIGFPGNLPNVLTVGASNQWDQRKTRTSEDGETNWGSNFGDTLDVMGPGVAISTTDVSGPSGYTRALTTERFNGTSAATPFVSATAALMLSANPALRQDRLIELIKQTADPMTTTRAWDRFTGNGRVNAYAAIRAARRG